MLTNKKVLVGISGSIAAYKIPMLIRLLIKKGNEVRVVATDNALKFVSEVSLQTVSNYPVYNDMFCRFNEKATEHISLAQWADIIILAPASANIIGKYACAIADDALSTTLLAFTKKVYLCPAMNENMYNNAGVKHNIKVLQERGVEIIEANEGELACGTSGKGRMAEVEEIVEQIEYKEEKQEDLQGKTITITAGGSREKIDKVRFISNASSGKMGYYLAREALERGAKVNLISSVVSKEVEHILQQYINNKNSGLNLVQTISANDMFEEVKKYMPCSNVFICSAAVADYTPEVVYDRKLKKQEQELTIKLKPTQDILKYLGENKQNNQILIGFALETDNEKENAKKKLIEKHLDFIVLNSLNDQGAGFNYDTNKISIIDKENTVSFPLKTKKEVAKDIIDKLLTLL